MDTRLTSAVIAAALALGTAACGDSRVDAVRASAAERTTSTMGTLPPGTAAPSTFPAAGPDATSAPTTSTPTTATPTTATPTTAPPTTRATTPRPTPTTLPPTTTPTTRFPGDTRRAVGWERYTVSGDGRTLTISYTSGPAPCSIPDGVEVIETSAAVKVTVFERDGSGGQPCILIAQQKTATVTLAIPLGSRAVADGART